MSFSAPTIDQLRSLRAFREEAVPDDVIDENGHMNISAYFRDGSWAVWDLLVGLGMGEDYIGERGLSFFTVEQRIRYVGELRLGERFSVRAAQVEQTAKAVHGISFILDEERGRLACAMETVHVHVAMDTRRAADIPADLAAAIDAEIASHPWVAEVATGLSLRR